MRRFFIRDDDTCFHTGVDAVARIYEPVLARAPVSFAVIPFIRRAGNRFLGSGIAAASGEDAQQDRGVPVGDNAELVDWLRGHVTAGRASILLHGVTHARQPGGVPELASRTSLRDQLARGRAHLEAVFGVAVRTLAPPSNKISAIVVRDAAALGLNLSTGPYVNPFDRPFAPGRCLTDLRMLARWLMRTPPRPWGSVVRTGLYRECFAMPYGARPAIDAGQVRAAAAAVRGPVFGIFTHHWDLAAAPQGPALPGLAAALADEGWRPSHVDDVWS